MEADSTGEENISNVQSSKVESSQVSSCDEDIVVVGVTGCMSKTAEVKSYDTDDECNKIASSEIVEDYSSLKHLNVETINLAEPLVSNEINLTEKELEHIEDSVLKKYTGLNMDLASENQLLKEDVIKCRCELEKYGKKLSMLERKLDKANSYNDDLRVQIDKLSSEVHEFRKEKHKVLINADTQTSSEDIMEDDTLYDVNLPGQKPDGDMTFDWKPEQTTEDATQDSLASGDMSLADSLKATAEAAMNQTGFVFDEQSGLYYDYTTGYYYNAEKGLYYDPKSGTYFYFNKGTGKYEFHSQVDLSYYTPTTHLYPDRSQGFHHHSSSNKYPTRSPDHAESSSGKKKKKKESRRRSSDERDHKRDDKKKKRKKERSRDSSSTDEEKGKKKRKKSTEKQSQDKTIIEDINKKFEDQSNIVMGELNYKKLKQSDKLKEDSLKKPKLLREKQTNVSICDDVIEDQEESSSAPTGLKGKKIKLVLKKKEKESTDEKDSSKEKKDSEKSKGDQQNDEKDNKNIEETECSEKMDPSAEPNKTDVANLTQSKAETISQSSNDKNDNTSCTESEKVTENPICEPSINFHVQMETENSLEQQHSTDMGSNQEKNELFGQDFVKDFVNEGDVNFDKVNVVSNEEILRICSKINSEKSPGEVSTDSDVAEKATDDASLSENHSQDSNTDKIVDKAGNIDNVTIEMLGVNVDPKIPNPKEKIIKLPVKRDATGEEDFYSDEDDIMIVEKEEEKIMIELDSDEEDDEPENKPKNRNREIEPGEITDTSSTDSSSSSSSSGEPDSQNEPAWVEIVRQPAPMSEESTLRNAPCIRAMVTLSDFLEEGTLFIVTIEGGFIGREKKEGLAICVPDLNVSKVHAEIRYNKKEQKYSIQDKGSQNGTFVNEERLSESKHVSKWIPLKHKDVLQLNCTRFELHIHHGNDTCDTCEPGQVIAMKEPEKVAMTATRDKKASHKAQLKSIKKKYGLVSSSYTDNSAAINNPDYQDKANERRKTVGSDNPHQPDSRPSSVYRPIQEENKGHKLLKKMGWTEGESLGKDNMGIQEPINVTLRVDSSAGLGAFGGANEMSIGNMGVVNARRRYLQTQLRIASSDNSKNKQFQPKLWVQGATQENIDSINTDSHENKTS